jgi:hypothetical protein
LGIYICVSEITFAVAFLLSGVYAMKFSSELMNYLKVNYEGRYHELTGSKLIGGVWVVGGRTSKAFDYIFNKTDNENLEILSLKKRVKRAMLFVLLAWVCFGLNAFLYIVFSS